MIVQSLYVHLKDRKQGGGKLMFMKHVVLQLIHNYINSTC